MQLDTNEGLIFLFIYSINSPNSFFAIIKNNSSLLIERMVKNKDESTREKIRKKLIELKLK